MKIVIHIKKSFYQLVVYYKLIYGYSVQNQFRNPKKDVLPLVFFTE